MSPASPARVVRGRSSLADFTHRDRDWSCTSVRPARTRSARPGPADAQRDGRPCPGPGDAAGQRQHRPGPGPERLRARATAGRRRGRASSAGRVRKAGAVRRAVPRAQGRRGLRAGERGRGPCLCHSLRCGAHGALRGCGSKSGVHLALPLVVHCRRPGCEAALASWNARRQIAGQAKAISSASAEA